MVRIMDFIYYVSKHREYVVTVEEETTTSH
jgi:hypothetical protein